MFQHLQFKNFKSWTEANLQFGNLTGIFGTNSSGKSSIFQLLLLLKQTAESSDRALVLEFGDSKSYVELGSFKSIINNQDLNKSLLFKMEMDLPEPLIVADPQQKGAILFEGKQITFGSEITQPGAISNNLSIQEFFYEYAGYRFKYKKDGQGYRIDSESLTSSNGFRFIRSQGRKWKLPKPVKFYGLPDQVNFYYQNAGFLPELQLKLEEALGRIYYLGPLRDYPQRQYTWAGSKPTDMGQKGEQVVDALLASKEEIRISPRKKLPISQYVAQKLKELGLIEEFRVKPIVEGGNLYQVLVRKNASSPEVLITDVGFGMSQILPVITLCYYVPPGSTLLIEQPEIHLHPSVQAGLADIFIDAIRKRNIQIVLESHSEHLLKRLQRRIAEQEISNENVCLYFCKVEQETSKLESLRLDSFGNILNWPTDFFGNEIEEIIAMSNAIQERKMQRQANGN